VNQVVKARREVILAASSINSPKILMLSGIGPAEDLKEHGIEVVADRPGVGRNLQDHLEVYVQQQSLKPITLYSKLNVLSKALIGAEWLFFKSGLGATNHFEVCAFVRSRAGIDYPDIQFHFLPVAVRYDGKAAAKAHGFQAHVGPMRSKSTGNVTLRSALPADKPVIRFNYMSEQEDWIEFRHAIRLTREIFAQPAFDEFRGPEIAPGDHVQSDDEIDGFIREHAESAYHPCGTCRMGRADDSNSVVDPECRVIGVEGLRVADSSIFPRITNGNLNAPSIMTGEKAADHILGTTLLPPSNLQPWINPHWQCSDR
jgi:choline dehydrogenase